MLLLTQLVSFLVLHVEYTGELENSDFEVDLTDSEEEEQFAKRLYHPPRYEPWTERSWARKRTSVGTRSIPVQPALGLRGE